MPRMEEMEEMEEKTKMPTVVQLLTEETEEILIMHIEVEVEVEGLTEGKVEMVGIEVILDEVEVLEYLNSILD